MTTYPQRRTRTRPRKPRPRVTRRPARRRRALPANPGYWALGIAAGGYLAVKTWPVQSVIVLILLAATAVTAVVGPARARRVLAGVGRAVERRPALPRPGTRTIAEFQRMSPAHFEQAIAELAAEHPSVASAAVVGGSNDRGMDVRVKLANGTDVLIQCKRYRLGNNVTSEEVMKVNGTYRDIHRCQQAAIVTTSDFTRSAYDTSGMLQQRIRLIPGEDLLAWANGGTPPWN